MGAIEGEISPGFEAVADAFAAGFKNQDSMGASLCIYQVGLPVVDLWGGIADARTGRKWDRDTISVVFSCTKGLVSILAAKLVEEGRLDYDALASNYWPEIAQSGKEKLLVRDLLAHRAGLSAPRIDLTGADIVDWDRVVGALEQQEPLWPPGEGYSYHAITHGWLVGELVRRVTGLTVGQYFADTIAGPLEASAWIGLPVAEEHRMAHMRAAPSLVRAVDDARAERTGDAGMWLERAMTLGGALPEILVTPDSGFNDSRLWRAEIPGAGGIANARGLARIWSATVCDTGGVRLLSAETVDRATQIVTSGPPVFDVPPPWAVWGMGFQLDSAARHYLSADSFGHDGAGGQVAFADPLSKVGFAFVTNEMNAGGDRRATDIIEALSACLAGSSGVATRTAIAG